MNGFSRNGVIATLAVATTLGFAACGGDDEDPAATPADATEEASAGGDAVTIKTFAYDPSPATVAAGTTVKFTNEDDILHTVTSGTREKPTAEFDEDLDGAGTTAEVTFDKPGTIDYFCDVHQGMDGQIVVE